MRRLILIVALVMTVGSVRPEKTSPGFGTQPWGRTAVTVLNLADM